MYIKLTLAPVQYVTGSVGGTPVYVNFDDVSNFVAGTYDQFPSARTVEEDRATCTHVYFSGAEAGSLNVVETPEYIFDVLNGGKL